MTKPIELRVALGLDAPGTLAYLYRDHIVPTVFALLTGSCGRCNRDLKAHFWQVVDPDEPEQCGVVDCATF